MPLYLDFNKSHPSPWSQSLDVLLTPSAGVCAPEARNDPPLEPTLTPSPVSSSTTTTEPPVLPFTLASRSLTEHHSPSELSDSYHQTRFRSRPTSASGIDRNGSPDHQPQFSDDHHQLPGLNHPPQQSPLRSVHQPGSGLATDRMRSLDILDHPPDRSPHHDPPALAASSSEHQPSPDHLGDLPPTDPPNTYPPPLHKTTRGALKILRPIQPIQGPPPPVLHKARGPWHKDEDAALLYWVSHLGTGKWVDIAKRVGSRSGKQCRERWTNQLSPEIDHSAFRHEEDMLIITLQQSLQANKWCEVAKYLPGRPENAIKNRWNSRDLQRKRSELCVNMNSGVAPFGFMLQNHQEPSRISAQIGLPYGASPKRARSPQTSSSIDLHHRLGLPYQTPRNPGAKKHRVVIEPRATVHRNLLSVLSSPSKLGFTNQNDGLVPPSNQNIIGHHPAEKSSLSGQGDLNHDWTGYHTTTPPSTCSSSNPRVHCFQRNPDFAAGLSQQYYSTPTQSPTYLLDSSSTNSLASTETPDPRQQPRYPSTSYDELPTPKSGPLVGPPLPQHLFMGPNNLQAPHVKSNMFYTCYMPEFDNKKAPTMDLGSPEQSNYDTLLRTHGPGSGFPSSTPGKPYETERDEKPGRIVDQHQLGDFSSHSAPSSFFMPARARDPTLSADHATDQLSPVANPADSINHYSSRLDRFDGGLSNPLSAQDCSPDRAREHCFHSGSWSTAALVLSHNNQDNPPEPGARSSGTQE